MNRIATPLLLSLVLCGAAYAQSGQVTGRVKDVFQNQFVLESDGQRLLVTPSEGAAMPDLHSTVAVTGTRDGTNVTATAIEALSGQGRATSADDSQLPEDLRGLGLTEIRDRMDDDGERRVTARLADGGEMRVEYDRQDAIDEVRTSRDGTLPTDLLTRILPTALLQTEEFTGIARVTQIEFDDNEIEVEGYGTDNAKIEIDASPEGAVLSFKRRVER